MLCDEVEQLVRLLLDDLRSVIVHLHLTLFDQWADHVWDEVEHEVVVVVERRLVVKCMKVVESAVVGQTTSPNLVCSLVCSVPKHPAVVWQAEEVQQLRLQLGSSMGLVVHCHRAKGRCEHRPGRRQHRTAKGPQRGGLW